MGKYQILYIARLAVLSFLIRGSQSRSLSDEESVHGKKTNCACFPKTENGTPVSKSLPFDGDQERLVVYFYKNGQSDELVYFIPNREKQSIFPDLTLDVGDKLQLVAPDGTIKLFETTEVPRIVEKTTMANIEPDEEVIVTMKPDILSDSQHEDNNGAKGFNTITTLEIPPEESTVSNNELITNVDLDQEPNLSVGNKQEPVNGGIIEDNQQPIEPLQVQNQQMFAMPDDLYAHIEPGKPTVKDEIMMIHLPKNPSELSNNHQNQNSGSPLEAQIQSIDSMPHVSNNSPGFRKLLEYALSGYGGHRPPSKANSAIISSSGIDTQNPHKQNNLVNIGYLPNKYKNPTFNEWYNNQIISLHLTRAGMSNALNVHLLKLLLVKALFENGIHLSENGDLRDSNGHVLKMTNLKLRSILLSDPMDYQKLSATRKCIIPYDIPYLEAILVTLSYPPRILAIIPLRPESVFISTPQENIGQKLCGQSNCNTHVSFRSGLPEEEDNTSDLIDGMHKNDNHEDLNITEDKSGDTYILPTNDYPFNNDLPVEITPDGQSGLDLTLTPKSNPGHIWTQPIENEEIIYLDHGGNVEERKSPEDVEVPQETPQKPDEEVLTIRIVGGNPATSSGTPVSSKGRSAFDF